MARDKDCMACAQECVARQTADPKIRDRLLNIARDLMADRNACAGGEIGRPWKSRTG